MLYPLGQWSAEESLIVREDVPNERVRAEVEIKHHLLLVLYWPTKTSIGEKASVVVIPMHVDDERCILLLEK